ncbi:MAG: OadG family protein [Desulfitobacteriaceae bacterium]|nr:OadG family protein [Desulfitobacteriaceae bacterium]MDD4752182.1 OadG family protein [Desulfitobacteriaceae bacterium]
MQAMEFMAEGISTTIIGMGVVFVVLIMLSIIISLLDKGIDATLAKKKAEPIVKAPAAPTPVVEAAVTGSAAKVEQGISPAVVAAITAAVCMMTGKTAGEFKFASIRRTQEGQPVWALMGTNDIIATRQRYTERGNR